MELSEELKKYIDEQVEKKVKELTQKKTKIVLQNGCYHYFNDIRYIRSYGNNTCCVAYADGRDYIINLTIEKILELIHGDNVEIIDLTEENPTNSIIISNEEIVEKVTTIK